MRQSSIIQFAELQSVAMTDISSGILQVSVF